MITEDQLEQLAAQWFQEAGWNHANGADLAPEGTTPERADFRVVVLKGRLSAAVHRLNPKLPPAAVEEVVHVVTTPTETSLPRNNRAFHRLLMDGVRVEFTNAAGEKKIDHAQLIDFQNPARNDFLVANQFTVTGTKKPRRPDLVAFVNGLPLGIIELKNPADTNADVWKAYGQLQTYKEEIADLLVYNEALVVSDGMNARVGSLTASGEWFMPWRTRANENDRPEVEFELENVVKGFFRPELFLDYIRYFVLYEQDGDALIKKIAGYHQFHGVREAVRVTLIASAEERSRFREEEPRAAYGRAVVPGSRKAGVFWHTQGSGKSISMCCYAGKLLQQPEMNNPTLVVVTDRNDLDGQLFQQFCAAKDLLKQTPEQAESRDQLREMLAARQSGGIIFTTIQKFSLESQESDHPVLCKRSNVVVITDEAHRSQYGTKAKLVDVKDRQTKEVIGKKYVFGYAKHMRDALPGASFIGFTGTPIEQADANTLETFGGYVSIYDIEDAKEDKATVPIYYESRLAKLDINRAEIEALNKDVEDVIEDEEDVSARESTKSKWAELAKLVGAKERVEEIAADLVEHYETRTRVLEGKAMIVAMSRDICVSLFAEIIKLRPDWAGSKLNSNGQAAGWNHEDGTIRIVMTGNATDKAALQDHVYSKGQKKRLERRFKDPNDPLKLVIVRDMWLTGFDAPCCHTMYVDKPMAGHNLMQAIARVNRVFAGKEGGLVVDYIGIAAELKNALNIYTQAKGKGDITQRAEQALGELLNRVDVLRTLFHGFDYSGFKTNPMLLLPAAANHILGLGNDKEINGKKRFLDAMAAANVAYSLCSTLDGAMELRLELAFFSAIAAVLRKHDGVNKKRSAEQKHSALKQILDNAVKAEDVQDIFQMAGLEKPNIGLLSDEFLEDVRRMEKKNLAVELLERLLTGKIKAQTRTNLVQEKKYSERLIEALRKYHNRMIESSQVIAEMIAMAKDMQAAMKRDEELGLNPDEVAFYDALAERPEVLQTMGDETLKKLATELTEKLRSSTTVDWQVRDSVRASMRLLIKRLLRKYKYPPEGQDEAVALVLKQAEALAEVWSGV
ncbi:MAG TPA: type I restriction endonuclease subunit R [Chthoniobacterales bacterium]